jgi:hypothetical protein
MESLGVDLPKGFNIDDEINEPGVIVNYPLIFTLDNPGHVNHGGQGASDYEESNEKPNFEGVPNVDINL